MHHVEWLYRIGPHGASSADTAGGREPQVPTIAASIRFGALPPTGNSIQLNWLSGNTPNDIYGDGTGTTNTISGNVCTTTNLAGAC